MEENDLNLVSRYKNHLIGSLHYDGLALLIGVKPLLQYMSTQTFKPSMCHITHSIVFKYFHSCVAAITAFQLSYEQLLLH